MGIQDGLDFIVIVLNILSTPVQSPFLRVERLNSSFEFPKWIL